MICLQGKVICSGTAFGTAYISDRKTQGENKTELQDKATELKKLDVAISSVKQELTNSIKSAENAAEKDIFEVHRMMLEDEDFLDFLHAAVNNDGLSAQTAIKNAEQYFSQMFKDTKDDYMIARIDDIRDVCARLTAFLNGEKTSLNQKGPAVLVAKELLPSDLINFGTKNIIGIVISSGAVYSHVSILIRELGIPAVICEDISDIKSGTEILVNGDNGTVILEPDNKTLCEFKHIKSTHTESKVPNFNKLPCTVYVNIGDIKEISDELFNRCDGIGLFRTEYLYVGKSTLPSEEEQFSIYKELLIKANGKNVTVRTFDIGSDKSCEALPLKKEENPALGIRGLRVYSLYPEVFKTQIKALLRAAVYGNLSIMYPMVTSLEEIEEIHSIISDVAEELKSKGIPYKLPIKGAMIETPAAALLSDEIAKAVDFLSLGTNDLTQYTLALDREEGHLEKFFDNNFKAVISLIKIATENAHKNGIKIGICGELASEAAFSDIWIKLGIDYLSVLPSVL